MPNRDKLLYFIMLRQMEASSDVIRTAYGRLSEAISGASGWDLRTVILDWLETELRTLPENSDGAGHQLMKAAVAMSQILKQ